MSQVIKPTIGRRVWFRPSADFLARNPTFTQLGPSQPMDAGIVYVHHDSMVNLAVCDHVGRTHMVLSVPLLSGPWYDHPDSYCVCEWMPYQKAQASKDAAIDRVVAMNTSFGDVSAQVAAALTDVLHESTAPAVTDEMVNRFLGWKLPADFSPDCYIRFDREAAGAGSWPVGTNLLTAAQARAMLEHVLGVKPAAAAGLNLASDTTLAPARDLSADGSREACK